MNKIVAPEGIGHNSKSFLQIVEEDAGIVFRDKEIADAFLAELKQSIGDHKPDMTTERGRKEIASLAYGIARRKTSIDDAGKKLNEDARKAIGVVDEKRRSFKSTLEKMQADVREPLDKWETAEKAKRDHVTETLAKIDAAGIVIQGEPSTEVFARIEWLENLDISEGIFGDMLSVASSAQSSALEALVKGLEASRQAEAERAELDRLRAEAAKRQEEENARLAAEEAAKAEEAAAKRLEAVKEAARLEERERIIAAENKAQQDALAKAEREAAEKIAAARRAQEAAEADLAERRRADEQAARDEAARNADVAHRSAVMRKAKDALIAEGGCSETAAKKLVLAICAGRIPHVELKF